MTFQIELDPKAQKSIDKLNNDTHTE